MIGERLAELRKDFGWDQKELTDKLKVTYHGTGFCGIGNQALAMSVSAYWIGIGIMLSPIRIVSSANAVRS